MRKIIITIILIIVLALIALKYGADFIKNPKALFQSATGIKTDVQKSLDNLKKEGETKINQAQELKAKAEDKYNKFNKAVDAVNDLTK